MIEWSRHVSLLLERRHVTVRKKHRSGLLRVLYSCAQPLSQTRSAQPLPPSLLACVLRAGAAVSIYQIIMSSGAFFPFVPFTSDVHRRSCRHTREAGPSHSACPCHSSAVSSLSLSERRGGWRGDRAEVTQ